MGTFNPDVIAAAQAADLKRHIPASVTLAQWAIESGYGAHMPPGSNNPFGIKARSGDPRVVAMTREEIDGVMRHELQPFRKFGSLADAFDYHAELLATHDAYAPAREALASAASHAEGVHQFVNDLTHVYATDSSYGATLWAEIEGKGLLDYDFGKQPLPAAPALVPVIASKATAVAPAAAASESAPVLATTAPPKPDLSPSPFAALAAVPLALASPLQAATGSYLVPTAIGLICVAAAVAVYEILRRETAR